MRTGVALALGLLLLSGCTAFPQPEPEPTASAPELPAPGSIVATGSFGESGQVRGDVVIRITERQLYSVELTDFVAPAEPFEAVLVPRPLDDGADCFDSGFRVGVPLSAEQLDAVVGDLGTITPGGGGDPTFLWALVLAEFGAPGQPSTCIRPLIAWAQLDWDFPDLHPDLEPTDLGERAGARGEVVGRLVGPQSYTVAEGDALSAVAERFDVTVDELLFLNPTRITSDPDALYAGETLNLDKHRR